MIKNLSILVCFIFSGYIAELSADSPITSTDFYKAYQDLPKVKEALSSKDGLLTRSIADYLLDETVPIDHSLAVINALSWNIDGKSNVQKLEQFYFEKTDPLDPVTLLQAHDSPRMMIIVAYLATMDNYFDIEEAGRLSKAAQLLAPDVFSIAIISSLINTQKSDDWCQRYLLPNIAVTSFKKNYDMRDNAVNIIMAYMNLYSGYCPQYIQNLFGKQ